MTDEQKEILEKHENRILNFAHAKDGRVYIYGDDGEEVDLNEFLAKHCPMGCDVELFREQGCSECASCPLAALNMAAIQAAELQEQVKRLKEKDKERCRHIASLSENINDLEEALTEYDRWWK